MCFPVSSEDSSGKKTSARKVEREGITGKKKSKRNTRIRKKNKKTKKAVVVTSGVVVFTSFYVCNSTLEVYSDHTLSYLYEI